MDVITVERSDKDTITKALAYCAVTSKGKFAENCQEVWQKLADTKEATNVKL
jgi:hypothetical protein